MVKLQNAYLKVNQFSDSLINRFFIVKTFYLMQVCINRKPATKVLYDLPTSPVSLYLFQSPLVPYPLQQIGLLIVIRGQQNIEDRVLQSLGLVTMEGQEGREREREKTFNNRSIWHLEEQGNEHLIKPLHE